MARHRKVKGTCRLCGTHGPLSFEHVPPEKAFNNQPVVISTIKHALGLRLSDEEAEPFEGISQRGAGEHTLCENCNSKTGGWYGGAFVEWCRQGLEVLEKSGKKPSVLYATEIHPLRVIKQIVTMFFSVNNGRFRELHPDLVSFCLDRERQYLDPRYTVLCYYNVEGEWRHLGVSHILKLGDRIETIALCEITFPPFGYVMTIDSEAPDRRLADITWFSRCTYSERRTVNMTLPVLPAFSPFPGDYRTLVEIGRSKGEESWLEAENG